MNSRLVAIERGLVVLVHLHERIGPMIDNKLPRKQGIFRTTSTQNKIESGYIKKP